MVCSDTFDVLGLDVLILMNSNGCIFCIWVTTPMPANSWLLCDRIKYLVHQTHSSMHYSKYLVNEVVGVAMHWYQDIMPNVVKQSISSWWLHEDIISYYNWVCCTSLRLHVWLLQLAVEIYLSTLHGPFLFPIAKTGIENTALIL